MRCMAGIECVRHESISREARNGGVSREIITVSGCAAVTTVQGAVPDCRVTSR